MKVFTVVEPLFKTEPLFVIGCTHEALDNYLKRRFRTSAGENCGQVGQMFTFTKPPLRVVWSQNASLPVVLHELFHLVTRICYDKGVRIVAHDENNHIGDETAAYLYEFFARALLRRYR